MADATKKECDCRRMSKGERRSALRKSGLPFLRGLAFPSLALLAVTALAPITEAFSGYDCERPEDFARFDVRDLSRPSGHVIPMRGVPTGMREAPRDLRIVEVHLDESFISQMAASGSILVVYQDDSGTQQLGLEDFSPERFRSSRLTSRLTSFEMRLLIILSALREAITQINQALSDNHSILRLGLPNPENQLTTVSDGDRDTDGDGEINGKLRRLITVTWQQYRFLSRDRYELKPLAQRFHPHGFEGEIDLFAIDADSLPNRGDDTALAWAYRTIVSGASIRSTNGRLSGNRVKTQAVDIYVRTDVKFFIPIENLSFLTTGTIPNFLGLAPSSGTFYDLSGTLVHEMLHALGLGHISDSEEEQQRARQFWGNYPDPLPSCVYVPNEENIHQTEEPYNGSPNMDPCSLTQVHPEIPHDRIRNLDLSEDEDKEILGEFLTVSVMTAARQNWVDYLFSGPTPGTLEPDTDPDNGVRNDDELMQEGMTDQLGLKFLYPPRCTRSAASASVLAADGLPDPAADGLPDPAFDERYALPDGNRPLWRALSHSSSPTDPPFHPRALSLSSSPTDPPFHPPALPPDTLPIAASLFSTECGTLKIDNVNVHLEEGGSVEARVAFTRREGGSPPETPPETVDCQLFGSDAHLVLRNPTDGERNATYIFPGIFLLRINASLCLPGGGFLKQTRSDSDSPCREDEIEIRLSGDSGHNFALDALQGDVYIGGLTIPATELGNSGISFEANNVAFDFNSKFNAWQFNDPDSPSDDPLPPPALGDVLGETANDPGWKGVYIQNASLTFSAGGFLELEDVEIGVNHLAIGLSGDVSANITLSEADMPRGMSPADECLSGEGGLQFRIGGGFCGLLQGISLIIRRDSIQEFELHTLVRVPFVKDAEGSPAPLSVTFSIDDAGNFTARLTGASDGVIRVNIPAGGDDPHVSLILKNIGFGVRKQESGERVAFLSADGKLSIENVDTPNLSESLGCPNEVLEAEGIDHADCKGVSFEGFEVDSSGAVTIPGGWVDLNEMKVIDFEGFSFTIRKFGFGPLEGSGGGSDESNFLRNGWIGLGGSFQLAADFSTGIQLNELRLQWWQSSEPSGCTIELGGANVCLIIPAIGISFEYAKAVKIEGKVMWRRSEAERCFAGRLNALFPSLDVSASATVIVGRNSEPSFKYWFFDAAAQLPSGIPIASDISIYGLAGGIGQSVTRETTETGDVPPPEGGASPEGCSIDGWSPDPENIGKFAVTFGVTLGTTHDNGYTANVDARLIVTPGPVISVIGKAWLLTPRTGRSLPPTLDANIQYNAPERIFHIYVEGQYDFKKEDKTLVSLRGSVDMLYSPPEWHVFIGEPPKDKRILAEILNAFTVDAYFNIGNVLEFPGLSDPRPGILLGASAELDTKIDVVIVVIFLNAWISGDLATSFSPVQTWVALGIGGNAGIRIFGIGLSLSLEALAQGQFPDPKEFKAKFKAAVNLPWPLPDFSVSFNMRWHSRGDGPLIASPLHEDEDAVSLVTVPAGEPNPLGTALRVGEDDRGSVVVGRLVENQPLNARVVLKFTRPIDGPGPPRSFAAARDATGEAPKVDRVGAYDVQYWLTSLEWRERTRRPPSCDADGWDGIPIGSFWGATGPLLQPPALSFDAEGRLLTDLSDDREATYFDRPGTEDTPRDPQALSKLVLDRRRSILTTFPIEGSALATIFSASGQAQGEVQLPNEFIPVPLLPERYYQVRFTLQWEVDPTRAREAELPEARLADGGRKEYIYCFGTVGVPEDLTSNVAWAHPLDGSRNAYTIDPLRAPVFVLFNAKQIAAAVGGELRLELYDQTGRLVASVNTPADRAGQIYSLTDPLEPRSRYFARVVDRRGRVLFRWQFTTSQFGNFAEAMDESRLLLGCSCTLGSTSGTQRDDGGELARDRLPVGLTASDPYLALRTPEMLPWSELGRLEVRLVGPGGREIPLSRISPADGTIQVFRLTDPLARGAYRLEFIYHSGVIEERLNDFALKDERLLGLTRDTSVKVIEFMVE